jgi:hypothetical protein
VAPIQTPNELNRGDASFDSKKITNNQLFTFQDDNADFSKAGLQKTSEIRPQPNLNELLDRQIVWQSPDYSKELL